MLLDNRFFLPTLFLSNTTRDAIRLNNALLDDLTAITPESAMANWLFKIKINDAGDLDSLMDEAAYNAMIG